MAKDYSKWLEFELEGPMKLYCDNKSTINIAHKPIQNERENIYIEIDRHLIKEKLEVVDMLTMGLSSSKFDDVLNKLGMEDIYSSA